MNRYPGIPLEPLTRGNRDAYLSKEEVEVVRS